jgi:hypothetical protein
VGFTYAAWALGFVGDLVGAPHHFQADGIADGAQILS